MDRRPDCRNSQQKSKKITPQNMAYQFLTSKNVSDVIGKQIRWTAPAYKHNAPYKCIAIINIVLNSTVTRFPLVCETIEGDNLSFAYLDGEDFVYTDNGRQVTFEIIFNSRVIKNPAN